MPEISRFFGIVVAMYYSDHNPPHFHVRYGSQKAIVGIDPMIVIEGRLAPRALGLVMEWSVLHRDELMRDWNLARSNAPLNSIAPLE